MDERGDENAQEIKLLKAEVAELKHARDTLEEQQDEQDQEIDRLKAYFAVLEAQRIVVEKQRDEKARENRSLRSQTAELSEGRDNMEQERDKYVRKVEKLKVKVSKVGVQLYMIEDAQADKADEVDDLKAQVIELEKERDELVKERDREIEDLQENVDDLMGENEALRLQLSAPQASANQENNTTREYETLKAQHDALWQQRIIKETYRLVRVPMTGEAITWSKKDSVVDTTIVRDMDDLECTICRDEYGAGDVLGRVPCGHYFHEHRIYTWVSGSLERVGCPRCTQEFFLKLALCEKQEGKVVVVDRPAETDTCMSGT